MGVPNVRTAAQQIRCHIIKEASDMPNTTTEAIIGGETTVTISAAIVSVLSGLPGFKATGLGSAKLSTDKSGDLLAEFPITGGTKDATGDVILHQDSGLELSDASGYIKITDLRVDTNTDVVYADVITASGTLTDVAVFDIGAGAALTVTAAAAAAIDAALGTKAVTAGLKIGSAAPDPVLNPLPTSFEESPLLRDLFGEFGYQGGTEPIVSGVTDVTLTSASVLHSLGVSVTGLGTASISTKGGEPVAAFDITGGTETPQGDVILHEGSGLELSNSGHTVTVELQNFIVDTIHDVVDANVTINGTSVGNLAVFTLGSNGQLTLTAAAAAALDAAFKVSAFTDTTVIGDAAAHPFALTHTEASLLAASRLA